MWAIETLSLSGTLKLGLFTTSLFSQSKRKVRDQLRAKRGQRVLRGRRACWGHAQPYFNFCTPLLHLHPVRVPSNPDKLLENGVLNCLVKTNHF